MWVIYMKSKNPKNVSVKPKVIVIVPAYNEADIILTTVKSLENIKKKVDYVVVNDGSSDNTLDLLRDNDIPHVNLINNLGIGGCVQAGYKYAMLRDYDIAIQFDGDNQHDARDIPKIIEEVSRCDMVIGSRFVGADESGNTFVSSMPRRIGIKLLSALIELTTGAKIKDVTSGYRAVNKKVLKRFTEAYPSDYPEPETIAQIALLGYDIREVPVRMHKRTTGRSSIAPLRGAYYILKVSMSIILLKLTFKKERTNLK